MSDRILTHNELHLIFGYVSLKPSENCDRRRGHIRTDASDFVICRRLDYSNGNDKYLGLNTRRRYVVSDAVDGSTLLAGKPTYRSCWLVSTAPVRRQS